MALKLKQVICAPFILWSLTILYCFLSLEPITYFLIKYQTGELLHVVKIDLVLVGLISTTFAYTIKYFFGDNWDPDSKKNQLIIISASTAIIIGLAIFVFTTLMLLISFFIQFNFNIPFTYSWLEFVYYLFYLLMIILTGLE